MLSDQIKISIITVSYNVVQTIEQTISSVVNQTYPNIEYIIIDGGSTDGTVDTIKKHQDKIAYWVSEPDKGIYDAMNKGIDAASGRYVYFIGADDWLAADDTVKDVVDIMADDTGYDFYCGKVILYDSKNEMVKENGCFLTPEDIKYGSFYPHQGMFAKLELLKSKFKTKYMIAADFEFLLRNVLQEKTIKYMNKSIAFYSIDGTSSSKALDKLYDEYKEIILNLCGREYVGRITLLQDNLQRKSLRKILKNIIIFSFGKKFFWRLRGWQQYNG